ncbi:hypothetical protein Poly24_47120 [Rosistilla carotiformis]|uniref:VWFA domain-containing protein n=1 Tax=Rosistilla carotiformis TaxID=2528017 RepID=A0A518JZK5_9BACT|nr:hypothetical protein [Rosistilla carotiformis]QDV70979.1 hypothetical protein Poly24_47120 [Rosistilla carotiformis]
MPIPTKVSVSPVKLSSSSADWRGYATSATVHAIVLLTLALVIAGKRGVATFIVTASEATAEGELLVTLPLENSPPPRALAEPVVVDEVLVPPPPTTIATTPIRVDVPSRLPAHRSGALDGLGGAVVPVAHAVPVSSPSDATGDSQTEPGENDAPHATFFGSHAYGNNFVFILDASPSMIGARYQRACDELVSSLTKLTDQQSFYVFLFSWRTQLMFDGPLASMQFIPATDENVDRFRQWLYMQDVRKNNGTDPRVPLDLAERLRPDAVFLLSDGEFNKPPRWNPGIPTRALPQHSVVRLVEMIYETIPLHCIAFEIAACEPGLRALAELTGGSCRFVPKQRPDADQVLMAKIEHQLRLADPQGTGDGFHAQQARITIASSLVAKGFLDEAREMIAVLDDKKLPPRLQRKLDSVHRDLLK